MEKYPMIIFGDDTVGFATISDTKLKDGTRLLGYTRRGLNWLLICNIDGSFEVRAAKSGKSKLNVKVRVMEANKVLL
jgi:hypothetical protein